MSTEQYIILFWKKHSYLIGYFDNKHIEEAKVTAVFECICSKSQWLSVISAEFFCIVKVTVLAVYYGNYNRMIKEQMIDNTENKR